MVLVAGEHERGAAVAAALLQGCWAALEQPLDHRVVAVVTGQEQGRVAVGAAVVGAVLGARGQMLHQPQMPATFFLKKKRRSKRERERDKRMNAKGKPSGGSKWLKEERDGGETRI